MEAALVSVATGALKPILGKLAVLLGDKYKRFKGVRKAIKSLGYELASMDAFLMKMSEEEDPDVQDIVWMNEVRELSYDMEACIDDFMQSVDGKDAEPTGFIEKMKHSLGKLGKMKARRRIGIDIEDLKQQIIEVGERNERYKTRQTYATTQNVRVDPRALVIFEDASKLVGIDEPKAEVIKLLIEEDVHLPKQKQLKIVSIVGPGGMGKTTLANQVYHEFKEQFKCRAFLSVSRNPDMMSILRTILSQVSNQSYGQTEEGSLQQIIMNINDFLADKRFFIVVDDIWDVQTWDVIKGAFPIKNLGSIIITTTRMNDVAHACSSSFDDRIYKIRPLDMVHSRKLFHRRLFNSENNCPSYLEDVSEQILVKCAGLPLAIIAISGLLSNIDEEKNLWNRVKDSIGRALERNDTVEFMMKILALSYYDLPIHLKSCLLYLSMYPEDSVIEKKELIRRWIAEGFVHREERYTTKELGERYFNDLINRSLIQPEKTNKSGKLKSCRVHDTVLDFIISKSIEVNFVTFVGVPNLTVGTQGKVRRLSLQSHHEGNSILLMGLVLSHIRSLSVASGWSISSLSDFKHLRVLHFELYDPSQNHRFSNIGRLLQLRYLNLRRSQISELPENIGDLGCLEMLDIRSTLIHKLPPTIVKLGKLVDLLVDHVVRFPNGISKMQSLEVLQRVGVLGQPLNFLLELGQLKNLRKLALHLMYFNEETVGFEECKKVFFTSLHNLGTQNLGYLHIEYDDILMKDPSFPSMLSLKRIKTFMSGVPQVQNWLRSLVNLRQLCLEVHAAEQEDLCILGGLPALLILDLKEVVYGNSCKKILIVSEAVGFRCLKQFSFGTNDGKHLVFAAGSMPKLEKLEIVSWIEGAADYMVFGIKNLPCLITVRCDIIGDSWHFKHIKTAMERVVSRHPNHPTLIFPDSDYDYEAYKYEINYRSEYQ